MQVDSLPAKLPEKNNAAGNFKLKPMVIYYFENPRSLNNYVKRNLPMLYKWNNKSWMIAHLLQHGLLDILNPLLKPAAQKKKKKFLSDITVH